MVKEAAVKNEVVALPKSYLRDPFGSWWCVGCGYPLIIRLVCEVLDETGVAGDAIVIGGSGCHTGMPFAINVDFAPIAHGRGPDSASAIKRLRPDRFVFTLQGDGDCIAIGTESLVQAAARGELITVIMTNNGCYGNTGGQMAPTTALKQVTATTSDGRDAELHGLPIRAAELVAALDGTAYSARGSVSSPANYQRTKKYLKAAFQKQLDRAGFSFVEIVSMCPVNWRLSPLESLRQIDEEVVRQFPLGEFKNVERVRPVTAETPRAQRE